jgi:flagellar basal-body rod protein FlgB
MTINFKDALGVHADALHRARRAHQGAGREHRQRKHARLPRRATWISPPPWQATPRPRRSRRTSSRRRRQRLYRVPFHPSADGNTVEIGVEQAAFSQNASDFQTSLTFINMKLRGLAKAINGQ